MRLQKKFPIISAPVAPLKTEIHTYHGHRRCDDYAWLRAENWQDVLKDPSQLPQEIKDYLDAENDYQQKMMRHTEKLQKKIFQEIKGRIREEDISVPVKDGDFLYGSGFASGAQYPYFFRVNTVNQEKKIFLEGEIEQKDKAYFQFGSIVQNPQHQLCLWGYDDTGSEYYTLKIRDFTTGKDLAQSIHDTAGYGVWNAQGTAFYYTKVDTHHRPSQVYCHMIGTAQSEDQLVFHEQDPAFFVNLQSSKKNDYLFIDIHDHQSSEIWIMNATDNTPPVLVRQREEQVEYSLKSGGDIFYILTNINGAKDFKIMTASVNAFTEEHWQEFIPHKEGRLILSFDVTENFLIWLELENALPKIVVCDRHTRQEHLIAFDEEAYSLSLQGASEYENETIRFTYSSMTTPTQTFDYDMRQHSRTLLKTQEIPSGHEPKDYRTQRLMAPAEDGELIPISIVYHKDTPLCGEAPCLLYGYGAYGITIPASFNSAVLSLLNRGFIYAIAHIRGGQDKGVSWYEHGKKCNKINTFTDFITVGRYLVKQKFTHHQKLIAYGGSAGGLLMGAIANMAPQDYAAIIALVPFVDTLNTILDDTLPLTPPEWTEWGNPIQDKNYYNYILSYAPYEQIKAQNYPAILAIGGLTDPRVTYWEPAKWVAKLRHIKTDDNPLLLRINMGAGHGGASGRFTRLLETAFIYSFALAILDRIE